MDRSFGVRSAPDLDAMYQENSDYGLRFAGFLTPPFDGEYAFRAEVDTGVRLKMDGKPVIDGWAKDGDRTGKVTLVKGRAVPLVVEYFYDVKMGGRKAVLCLFWTPPGGLESPVPASAYSHIPPPKPPPPRPSNTALINVYGDEQARLDLNLPDGGLKPVVGVHNVQIFRSSRAQPELGAGDAWTFAHHQDMACWKGRLYVAWERAPVWEEQATARICYATSTDGFNWSAPSDLFPREFAWPFRFYFYRATNGRMLAFCAGKTGEVAVVETSKTVLLVREISADHRLGKVYTLINLNSRPGLPPPFQGAEDAGFVAACREACGNNLLLEQQDYGIFLGERRMKWHGDPSLAVQNWCQFGKAFCFYHRADGQIVGLCKMGFATLSGDGGRSWSKPAIPPTVIAGSAKIWGQRTADGRYALVYTPDRDLRYPLVLVHGDDGRGFRDMRVVHGELPRRRYQGKYKDPGPQYMRGLAEWSDDGTFPDKKAMWLTYSMNKEDIWISRVPLPVKPDETGFPTEDGFEQVTPGVTVPGWNIYSPCWARVTVVDDGGRRCLELRDSDPYDYARAVRVFPASAAVQVELRVKAEQADARLEIELCDALGRRPIRLALAEDGTIEAADGGNMVTVGNYKPAAQRKLLVTTDLTAGRYIVQVGGGEPRRLGVAENGIASIERLSLRTGPWRGCGGKVEVDAKSDVLSVTPAVFRVSGVVIEPSK